MIGDYWKFAVAAVVGGVWIGVWMFIKMAQTLDDIYDVLATDDDCDDEVEVCPAERQLLGVIAGRPGHLHTCTLDDGHDEPHLCPACRLQWTGLAPKHRFAAGRPITTGRPYIVGTTSEGPA